MEEDFYKDDFEKFLQDQVKHHKMFPSDRIWRNIHNTIHQDYKWPALTIAALAFIAATIAVSVYFSPGPNIFAIKSTASQAKGENTSLASSPILKTTYKTLKSGFTNSPNNNLGDLVIDEFKAVENTDVSSPASGDLKNNSIAENLIISKGNILSNLGAPGSDFQQSIINNQSSTSKSENGGVFTARIAEPILNISEQNKALDKTLIPKENLSLSIPMKKKGKENRFDYTVYITPSASYRKLEEDRSTTLKQSLNVGGPVAINYTSDVNQVVRHKPGTGMEAGFNLGYNLTNKLRVFTGVQVNARQYSIEAFLSAPDVATIAFLSGTGVDSLVAYSSFRTSNGYEATELENRYYQVSIPVGIQYQLLGNKNIQLNVAAGVQPTYMISENSFLISTDFKNYIESPEMARKWNINANIETFLSIKSGTYKWQFGPQFRYQIRPTSIDKYPIREYLVDYGVKIGVVKSLK